jgi:threonine dehydratase
MSEYVSLTQIKEAKEKLQSIIVPTPLLYSKTFSHMTGADELYLKPECLQKSGSFKVRGAYNKITSLTEEQRKKGVVAFSAGNHGSGTAYAAKVSGTKCTIIMPKSAVKVKVDAVKDYGADVLLHGKISFELASKAKELSEQYGYTLIHPFDDPYTIAGQGTIGLEIFEELPDVDVVVTGTSGGGLLSGVACALKHLNPNIKIYGVNAEGAQAMRLSLVNDKPTPWPEINTIADGLTAAQPGNISFKHVKRYADDVVVVSDEEIKKAMMLMAERAKLVAEPAGAAALAALLFNKIDVKGKKVVAMVSGGNVDLSLFAEIISQKR